MRVHQAGETATVTLSPREAALVCTARVPLIYSPGGLGPHEVTHEMARTGCTVAFGGASFVNAEANLAACLAQFRDVVAAEIAREDASVVAAQDYEAGFLAFPMGRFMDTMRGTKSRPEPARCPFRRPERVNAWERGYSEAHNACLA